MGKRKLDTEEPSLDSLSTSSHTHVSDMPNSSSLVEKETSGSLPQLCTASVDQDRAEATSRCEEVSKKGCIRHEHERDSGLPGDGSHRKRTGGRGRGRGGKGRGGGRAWRGRCCQEEEGQSKEENEEKTTEGQQGESYAPFVYENAAFEEYYKAQGICPAEEWGTFMDCLKTTLPAAVRVNRSAPLWKSTVSLLDTLSKRDSENKEKSEEALTQLPWVPHRLAWQWGNVCKVRLRKDESYKHIREQIMNEDYRGGLTRQEAVSMLPCLFLEVEPHHRILDMCASPGSKTTEVLDMLHWTLIDREQTKRDQQAKATTKDAREGVHGVENLPGVEPPTASMFPLTLPDGPDGNIREFRSLLLALDVWLRLHTADVPCSGDGTMRKNADVWRKWTVGGGLGLHSIQLGILHRGLHLLRVGGRLVYSTCSLNPLEDEAVVAAALKQYEGCVELVPPPPLPGLKYCHGKTSWRVPVPPPKVPRSLPKRQKPLQGGKTSHTNSNSEQRVENVLIPKHEDLTASDGHEGLVKENEAKRSTGTSSELISGAEAGHETSSMNGRDRKQEFFSSFAQVPEALKGKIKPTMFPPVDSTSLHLDYAVRVLPHQNNTGGFFVACFRKIKELPSHVLRSKRIQELSAGTPEASTPAVSEGEKVVVEKSPKPTEEKDGLPLSPQGNLEESVCLHSVLGGEKKNLTSILPGDTKEKQHTQPPALAESNHGAQGSRSQQVCRTSCPAINLDADSYISKDTETEREGGDLLNARKEDKNPLFDECSDTEGTLSKQCDAERPCDALTVKGEDAKGAEGTSRRFNGISEENSRVRFVSEDAKSQVAAALAIEAAGSYAGSVFHTLVPVDLDGGDNLSSVLAFYGLSKMHAPELVQGDLRSIKAMRDLPLHQIVRRLHTPKRLYFVSESLATLLRLLLLTPYKRPAPHPSHLTSKSSPSLGNGCQMKEPDTRSNRLSDPSLGDMHITSGDGPLASTNCEDSDKLERCTSEGESGKRPTGRHQEGRSRKRREETTPRLKWLHAGVRVLMQHSETQQVSCGFGAEGWRIPQEGVSVMVRFMRRRVFFVNLDVAADLLMSETRIINRDDLLAAETQGSIKALDACRNSTGNLEAGGCVCVVCPTEVLPSVRFPSPVSGFQRLSDGVCISCLMTSVGHLHCYVSRREAEGLIQHLFESSSPNNKCPSTPSKQALAEELSTSTTS
ncbi:nol1 nop2 sun family protein [Cystoisospora suis]|uniref:Nol1 nop2 sun family protein n=1 Tax=Cystoisospora suis TaxID=483139 RepID=A0A2C6L9W5_9APIC|nr:nol1 nop2 sun family protein [Cystoisospora suis]